MAEYLTNLYGDKNVEEIVGRIIRGEKEEKKICKCKYELKGFENYCPMCGKKTKKEKAAKEKKKRKK